MRVLPVIENGKILADAGQRLISYHYFPEDSGSREQMYNLLEYEKARALSVGPENHEETEFTKIIDRYLSNSEGQRGVAGLVTLCLAAMLKSQKNRPTLYGATSMASQLMKDVRNREGGPFFQNSYKAGEFVVNPVRAVSGRGDVEKRFRAHSCIGSLKAAAILAYNNSPDALFPHDLEAGIPRTIRTMAELERRVVNAFPEYFPNPWRIGDTLHDSMQEMAPFDLVPEMQELFGVPSLW